MDTQQLYDDISQSCKERLIPIKVHITLHYPFYAALLNRMEFVPSLKIDTLATDGAHIFYNPCYIMGDSRIEYKKRSKNLTPRQKTHICDGGLSDLEILAALVHEVLHCAFKHFTRREGRDMQVWNIACDYAINQIIVRDKIGKLHRSWLFDKRFNGMSAEKIYDLLMEEYNSNVEKIVARHGSSIDNHIDPDPTPGDNESGDDEVMVSPETVNSMLADDNLEANCSIFGSMDDVSIIASSLASLTGCPQILIDMAMDLKDPIVDWRKRILKTMLSEQKCGYWWKKPNKRTHLTPYKLPSRKPEQKIDICVALDMSGSISSDMRRDFMSELVGIIKQHRCYRVRLMCFDTHVHNEQIFDSSDSDLADLLNYKFVGGGGTDFMCVWKHLQGIKHKPVHLFMFTDGIPGGSWGLDKYCTTTFLITTGAKPPFGHHIPYRKDAKYRKKFGT